VAKQFGDLPLCQTSTLCTANN